MSPGIAITAAEDTLQGVTAIGGYIGKSRRQTYYLLEQRLIPGFKLGGQWHMRKSTYLAHLEKLEAAATMDSVP